jgi:hypothetical protein
LATSSSCNGAASTPSKTEQAWRQPGLFHVENTMSTRLNTALRAAPLALALLALAAPLGAAAQATAPAAAPTESVRPEVAALLNPGITALRAQQHAEALAKAQAADALPGITPIERFAIEQLRAAAANGLGDHATAVRAYQLVLASGRVAEADKSMMTESLLGAAVRGKDFPTVISTARTLMAMGVKTAPVRRSLVSALLQTGDSAGVVTELTSLLADEEAAGRKPAEDQLRLLAATQNKLGQQAAYLSTVERLLRHHPKTAYWRMRVGALQAQTDFTEEQLIDSYRLLTAAGAMDDAADYVAVAELALRVGLPGEARAAMEAGYAAGKLGTGDKAAAHQTLRARAQKEAADDQKQLASAPAPAANATGMALVGAGMGYVSAGQADKGLPLIERGLAKGGLRQPDQVRLRLGWAQFTAGKAEEAKATMAGLKDVAGAVGDMARLWLLLLNAPKS